MFHLDEWERDRWPPAAAVVRTYNYIHYELYKYTYFVRFLTLIVYPTSIVAIVCPARIGDPHWTHLAQDASDDTVISKCFAASAPWKSACTSPPWSPVAAAGCPGIITTNAYHTNGIMMMFVLYCYWIKYLRGPIVTLFAYSEIDILYFRPADEHFVKRTQYYYRRHRRIY